MISQCSFRPRRSNWSGGTNIDLSGPGTLVIQECSFEADASASGGLMCSVLSSASRTEILDCRFVDRGTPLATRIRLIWEGIVDGGYQEALVSRNVFWNMAGPDSGGPDALDIHILDGAIDVHENTFVRCGVVVANGRVAPPLTFEKNIIARGDGRFFVLAGGTLSCNDFWRGQITDLYGRVTQSNNISADPMFCIEPFGDVTIAQHSPCASEYAPTGCGRIGALDPACSPQVIKPTTWGRLKTFFR